ncbi:MAG: M14 family zinc carboxypeptidase [Eubacteriales bacterium]
MNQHHKSVLAVLIPLLLVMTLSSCKGETGQTTDSFTQTIGQTQTVDPADTIPITDPADTVPTSGGSTETNPDDSDSQGSAGTTPSFGFEEGTSPMTGTEATPTTPAVTTPEPATETTASTPITTAPVITDPPTVEPPDTDEHASTELVRVQDYIPDLYVNLRYAGTDNLAGRAIYSYQDAYLRYGTVVKLKKVQEELRAEGLSLMIWDAFRPLDAQLDLSIILPNNGTNPVKGAIPFNNGGTLSLAIVKADGTLVALPSDFDEDGAKSDRNFSDVSAEAAKYASLLDSLMKKYGFNPYLTKWYRYTDSTAYSLITAKTLDESGIVDCEQWITYCDSTVNMRTGPSTSYDIITKIPNGTRVTVCFFYEKFAFVSYGGMTGYISACYLRQTDENRYTNDLSTVKPVEKYSYEQMNADLEALAEEFPELLTLSGIGKSEEGRDLTLAILGNPDAEHKIYVSAAIHAREHMTATLAVAQIEYMLRNPDLAAGPDGKTVEDILTEVCFYIIPMSNPDGVTISQTGIIPAAFKSKYTSSWYASVWKANANGIDLNANFDADWEKYGGSSAPGSPGYMGYKGTAPECAAESKALAEFLRSMDFDLVLCYHCSGSVIYWSYGNYSAVNNQCLELAKLLCMDSGYTLGSQSGTSTAGLKDYAISKLGIPALTIEFGATDCPLTYREFENIWARCKDTLLTSALWVLEQ